MDTKKNYSRFIPLDTFPFYYYVKMQIFYYKIVNALKQWMVVTSKLAIVQPNDKRRKKKQHNCRSEAWVQFSVMFTWWFAWFASLNKLPYVWPILHSVSTIHRP